MITILIACDLDECVNDFVQQLLPLYNKKYNDNLAYNRITQYNLSEFIKPECTQIFNEFVNDQFIDGLNVAPDAVDVLTHLSKRHEIYFVTAGHPYTLRARDGWMERTFPFYRSSNLIVCRTKQLLAMDVLIDDHELNLVGGKYKGFLINKPWNKEFATSLFGITRVYGFADIPRYIQDMERRY